ncbi:hypothetical protein IJV79_04010 [bacterium]|nr:hypothetical protein [bacterium]
MSYRLEKPYSDKERADFVVAHNHNNGLLIEETEEALFALTPTEKLVDGVVVDNTEEYEKEQQRLEKERIGSLSVTKRVLALALEEMGISYAQLKEVIASNERAQLEWDLCVVVERANPLLDSMAELLGVTAAQLDAIFVEVNS